MRNVLIRIAGWASAGFLVSLGWGLDFARTSKDTPIEATVYALARLTQPTAGVILYIKPNLSLGLTWVAVTNALTYTLLGLIVKTVRQHHRPIHIST